MAYQYAEPLVSPNENNVGIEKIGIDTGDRSTSAAGPVDAAFT